MNWTDSCTIHIQWRGVTVSEGRHRTQHRREDRKFRMAVAGCLDLACHLTARTGDLIAKYCPRLVGDPLDSVQQITVRRRHDTLGAGQILVAFLDMGE